MLVLTEVRAIGTPSMVCYGLPLLWIVLDIVCLTGERIFPEAELTHLDGHQGSKPVR